MHCLDCLADKALWGVTIVLLKSLSWKDYSSVAPGKTLHINCSGLLWDGASSEYDNFTQERILKRPFFSDTREDSALYLLFSGPHDIAFSQHNSFIWMMVLKRAYVNATGEKLFKIIVRYPGKQSLLAQYDRFTWKLVLEVAFICDTMEDYTFIVGYPGRQLIELIW